MIRQNLEMIKKKGRKRHYRSCRQEGRQGRKPGATVRAVSSRMRNSETGQEKSVFEKFSDGRFDKSVQETRMKKNTENRENVEIEKT